METKLRDFSGESIYVGIDSHLKRWQVTLMSEELELQSFSQEADSGRLISFLERHFPGADYHCVYEAGFSGFNAQRELAWAGIDCIVIHPADVPTSDREKRQKSDRIDSRKLARGLKNGDFKAINVPDIRRQQDRSLLRVHNRVTRDITRVKNRIKFFLMFFGISVPKEYTGRWSKGLRTWLGTVRPGGYGDIGLGCLRGQLEDLLTRRKELEKQIKLLSRESRYRTDFDNLLSVPGVGWQTAMVLLTEIGDISRFSGIRELCSYFGLIPNCHNSGETVRIGRNTKRGNVYLKYILLEASWMAIRYDPSLLLCYKSVIGRMDGNKAIIKVARKLLNRVRFVMKNKQPYRICE